MSGSAIDLGTVYASVRIALEQFDADVEQVKSAIGEMQARIDEVSAQVKETLTSSFSAVSGPARAAFDQVDAAAETATAAISGVGAAGIRAGEEAAAGGEQAAVGLRGAGLGAKEGAGGVGSFIGKVAGIAGVIGTVELAAQGFEFLRDKVGEALKAGMEANQVAAQTVAGLKSTHDASGQTADSIDALATKTMQLTGIDDDSVHSAENMLLTFTNIGKSVFPQATQAVADLATKMNNGAIPSAQQMQQASVQLGKALGDPLKGYSALQRVGVTFTEQQKEQIKNFMASGDVAGAQNVILKEMNKEFGGAAQAAGQANGGIAILRAEMANTEQTIGQALVPALDQLTGALAPLLQFAGQAIPAALKFLSQHADEVKLVLAGVATVLATVVVPALAGLVGGLFATEGAIGGLIVGLGTISLPVVAVVAALVGLGLAFKHAYDTSAPFRQAVDSLKAVVTEFAAILQYQLGQALQAILPHLQAAAQWVGGELTQAFNTLVPWLTQGVQWLTQLAHTLNGQLGPAASAVGATLQAFGGWMQQTGVPAIQQFDSWLAAHLGPSLQQVAGWVQNTLLPAVARLSDWLTGTALPAVEGFASAIGTRLGPILQQLGGWFQTSVLPALKQFGGFLLTQVWPAVQQASVALRQFGDDLATRLGPALTNIGRFVSAFANILATVLKPIAVVVFGAIVLALIGLKDVWMAIWPGLSQVLFGVWEVIKGIIMTAWAIVSGIIKIGLDLLGGNWTQAWNDLKATLSGVWAGIQTILSGAWDIIKGLFTAEGAVLAGIWGAIWTALQNSIGAFFSALGTWLHDRLAAIGQTFSAFGTALHDDISSLWDKITSTIEAKATALRDAVLKPFNDAKGLIGGIVKGFANAAITELNRAIQGWADLGNDLGNVINTVAKAVGVGARVPTLYLPTITPLASGTKHHAGGLALVGEEGPELVHLPKGASVLPAKQTAGLMGYAGGVGDFFSSLGSHVNGALGAVAALLQEGPAGIVAQALGALGVNPASAPGMLGSLGAGAIATLRREVQTYVGALLATVSDTISGAASTGGSVGSALAGVSGAGRAAASLHFAQGGVLREAVAGVGLSSGRSYLLGENGPEAVTPLGQVGNGGVNIEHLEVTVVAAAEDGSPYQAGVAFGNGFSAGFQQARTQRGL